MVCKGKTLGFGFFPSAMSTFLSLTSLPSPTFLFSTLIWCFRLVSGRHRVGDRPLKSMSSHFASNSELASVFPKKKSTGMWQKVHRCVAEKIHRCVAKEPTGMWQKKVHRCVAKKTTGMWQKVPQEGGKDHWFGDLVALWPSAAFI